MNFKYDITWIMQTYLGEYPGSRADSDKKFIRAVKSFLAVNKIKPKTQLVIVSDGCEITHALYYKLFAKHECIKYAYVSKDGLKMYEQLKDGSTFYRGLPRQVGRTIADGYIHAFMDSDDFLMPTAATTIINWWVHMQKKAVEDGKPEYIWLACSQWYENKAQIKWMANAITPLPYHAVGELDKFKGLKSTWQRYTMTEPMKNVLSSTWNVFHKWDCKTRWADISSNKHLGEDSEDVAYCKGIRKEGAGVIINDAIYIRCHYTGIWDI